MMEDIKKVMNIQEACETLEELAEKEIKNNSFLTNKEFLAINIILFELSMENKYTVPNKYFERIN